MATAKHNAEPRNVRTEDPTMQFPAPVPHREREDSNKKQRLRKNRLEKLRRRKRSIVQRLDGFYGDFHAEFDVAIHMIMRCSGKYLVYDTSADDARWRSAEYLLQGTSCAASNYVGSRQRADRPQFINVRRYHDCGSPERWGRPRLQHMGERENGETTFGWLLRRFSLEAIAGRLQVAHVRLMFGSGSAQATQIGSGSAQVPLRHCSGPVSHPIPLPLNYSAAPVPYYNDAVATYQSAMRSRSSGGHVFVSVLAVHFRNTSGNCDDVKLNAFAVMMHERSPQ
ncbi:hypothetical protein CSOJ01_14319 [Colletotrichum sojae]|uniref:Uncharacterized protein n=1 Tax=Colletotrichum sojae TaxID=2175907 RepID=A0A8H6MJG7_9PEZI|nr:hypothetical protein CSOJ01_14319 [Colletotrichum sojae]